MRTGALPEPQHPSNYATRFFDEGRVLGWCLDKIFGNSSDHWMRSEHSIVVLAASAKNS